MWYIDKKSYPTIPDMIEGYVRAREPVTTDVVLIKGIAREAWELDHESVTVIKKLGEGAFGEVSMGKLSRNGKTLPVAIKQAKLEKLTKDQIKEFMGEARVMRQFQHPNVVRFYGVAADTEPMYMVMELASNGALDSYLKKNLDMSIEKRNELILQAAWGLEYLHAKPVMHRDIAARNCLFGDGRVKIADFGLTRPGTSYQTDPTKKAPIRWLGIEVMRTRMFTQASDVWAFAIMSWEIYNDGKEPYPGMMVAEVAQKVVQGFRMEWPAAVSQEVKDLLSRCWLENDTERPTMAQFAVEMERLCGIARPDFAAIEAAWQLEYATPAPAAPVAPAPPPLNVNVSTKTKTRKRDKDKKKSTTALPKGMRAKA